MHRNILVGTMFALVVSSLALGQDHYFPSVATGRSARRDSSA